MIRFMRMIAPIFSICLLGIGFILPHFTWLAVTVLAFGIFWVIGLVFVWTWIAPLGLFIAFGTAALGLFLDPTAGLRTVLAGGPYTLLGTGDLGRSAPLFLIGALFAFLAWDVDGFYARLRLASTEDDTTRLERAHLARLTGVMLASVVLGFLALSIHFQFSFEWVVVLMLFSVWGIGRLVNRLLKE